LGADPLAFAARFLPMIRCPIRSLI